MPGYQIDVGDLDFGDPVAFDDLADAVHATGYCPSLQAQKNGRSREFLCPDEVPLRPDLRLRDPERLLAAFGCATPDIEDRAVRELLIANANESNQTAPACNQVPDSEASLSETRQVVTGQEATGPQSRQSERRRGS